jgi:hypothetical protein
MKHVFLLLSLLSANAAFSIDRFVDPNLSSGNGTTLFTSIASAVTASVNGDRILIATGTYNEPTLTLNKSLTLLSQTSGTSINYNGNIVIAGFPGMKLEILGFNLSIYSVSSNIINGGSGANRAKVSLFDCRMTNLSTDHDYYELNIARCAINGSTTFRYGSFVVSKTTNLSITDESNSNLSNSSVLIANDTILGRLSFRNDDHRMRICNNRLKELYIWKWNYSNNQTNVVVNNDFIDNCQMFLPPSAPNYNFDISNNLFEGIVNFVCANACNGGYDGCDGCYCPGTFPLILSTTSSCFPGADFTGFFKWTYNGIDLPCSVPTGAQPLVLTKIIGPTGTLVDAGNPNHDYYDIDLTINDRGRTGGPYSILNYNPSINPSNGKAFIFDLDIPADLFPGQQVDIKAKGYHKN